MITAAQYLSGAENRIAAAEIRKRLWGKPKQASAQSAPVIKKTSVDFGVPKPKRLPLWMTEELTFDAHVSSWRLATMEMARFAGQPVKAYIAKRAVDFGLLYNDIIGPSRKKAVSEARQLIMWEIKTHVKPSMSFPELGRMMGGRDHTTCLYAVEKIDAQRAGGDVYERFMERKLRAMRSAERCRSRSRKAKAE